MSVAAVAPKRNRRLYTRSGDSGILQDVAKYQFVTVEMVAEDLARNIIAVRRRMMQLYQAGMLNRVRRDKLAPYVYFLSEKGSEEALRRGHLHEPRYINSKSPLLVSHDLEITMFHRALGEKLQEVEWIHPEEASSSYFEWEQWRGALKQKVQTEEGAESLIPDARFMVNGTTMFLEIVKSYESEYENGESNVEHKIGLYNQWWKEGGEDFRVCFVLPTKARVAHLLSKLEDRFPYRRFYFTDEESYRKNVVGHIWWTPRDFREATYSLLHEKP
jgi:hypothetical protein